MTIQVLAQTPHRDSGVQAARGSAERPAFVGYASSPSSLAGRVRAADRALFDPIDANPARFLQPPSWRSLMGTDAVGMDIFRRVDLCAAHRSHDRRRRHAASRPSIGTLIGALVGYLPDTGAACASSPRLWSCAPPTCCRRFPVFVFAIALVAASARACRRSSSPIAFVNAPIYLRLMRSRSCASAACATSRPPRLPAFGHADHPAATSSRTPSAPVLAQLSVNIGWAILLTAALSFIGAGVEAPTPEWGSMIAMGFQNVVTGHWWPSIFPGWRWRSPCSASR